MNNETMKNEQFTIGYQPFTMCYESQRFLRL